MPDLRSRQQYEAALEWAVLSRALAAANWAMDARLFGGWPVDWDEVRDDIAREADDVLRSVYSDSVRNWFEQYYGFVPPVEDGDEEDGFWFWVFGTLAVGVFTDEMRLRRRIGRFTMLDASREQSKVLADAAVEEIQRQVDAIEVDPTGEIEAAYARIRKQIADRLRQRVQTGAITEITRANALAELITAGVISDGDDLPPGVVRLIWTPYWYTENDAKVCPICRPLHGKPIDQWPFALQGGPPAHPRCRCWLVWEGENP